MNIRILAASALALAILIPAANAATPSRKVPEHSSFGMCPGGAANLNLGTGECKISNWVSPKKHKVIFVKKTDSKWNPNPDRGTGNHPSQL